MGGSPSGWLVDSVPAMSIAEHPQVAKERMNSAAALTLTRMASGSFVSMDSAPVHFSGTGGCCLNAGQWGDISLDIACASVHMSLQMKALCQFPTSLPFYHPSLLLSHHSL